MSRHARNTFDIAAVLDASIGHQHQIQNESTDHGQIGALIFVRIGTGKDMVPVDRAREHVKTTGERCQMTRQALRMREVGQWTHLQPVRSPSMVGVEVEAARGVETQLVVVRETEGLV